MMDRYSTRRNKKNSGLIYLVLAVVFIFFMVKWGLPGLLNLLAGPSGEKDGSASQGEDLVPPQTPIFAALPEATNSARIRLEGYTEPNVDITLYRDEELAASDKSGEDGSFSFDVLLDDGENKIYVRARDEAGNESNSIPETVVFDDTAVDVVVSSPTDGAEVFGKNNQTISVTGEATKTEVSVSVNGSFARVDSDGKFSASVRLNQGDNELRIKVTDKAGNFVEKVIKVKFSS